MNEQRKSGRRPALGLSVGSHTLAAVSADRSVTRRAAIRVNGSWITDFVERVADPVGIVAADGSPHRPEVLLAGELRSVARDVTGGERMPPNVAIAYPAQWQAPAVEALRRAIRMSTDWPVEPALIPDSVCAMTAVAAGSQRPAAGVTMLCDFGGGGTTISLIAADDTVIGGPARHLDFSGERIDRAVLAFVLGNLSCNSWPGLSGTLAFGPLIRLRDECRAVKERLSHETATVVAARETRVAGGIRFTRAEFDDVIDPMLVDLIDLARGTMVGAGVGSKELAAIATVGGGAVIPAITTALSEYLRVPVLTPARPGLSAAIGAALLAARPPAAATVTPKAVVAAPVGESIPEPVGRAWSAAPDVPRLRVGEPQPLRPQITFEPVEAPHPAAASSWYRRPMPVVLATLLVIVGAGLATVVGLRSNNTAASTAPPVPPTVVATPAAGAPAVAEAAPAVPMADPQPPVRTVIEAPPVTHTQVVQAPSIVETQVVQAPPVTQTRLVQAPLPIQLPPIPTALPIPAIPGVQLVLPGAQPSG